MALSIRALAVEEREIGCRHTSGITCALQMGLRKCADPSGRVGACGLRNLNYSQVGLTRLGTQQFGNQKHNAKVSRLAHTHEPLNFSRDETECAGNYSIPRHPQKSLRDIQVRRVRDVEVNGGPVWSGTRRGYCATV